MAVGELLLSAFFQVLFDRLASPQLFNFARQEGLASKLKKWEKKLVLIQAVLSDAEEKQLTDRGVKIWLDDLRDLAYDAEDVLDEFETKALEHKLMAENQNKILPCFSCLNPSTLTFNMNMDFKLEGITSRLEELCEQRIELGLQLIPGATSAATTQQRPASSSVRTEHVVYGRGEDKSKVLQLVLSSEPNDANFSVIPIVGMAGIGKTTLAREVYNDKAIDDFKFDLKAWVCVSDDFDVLSISRALLESITCRSCDLKALNEVQVELRKAMEGKKFLLVLDDVWNEKYNLWETLKAPFMAGAPNSKIIVTTRHSLVASTMGPAGHYNLKHLSDDNCWSVFMKHAFEGRDVNVNQISELFHKKVVEKCGGLPLAARTLGGLLHCKRDVEWERVLESKLWDLSANSEILPVLRLSYYHLPCHLKRCFAYCAIFPKDYEFGEEELVLLWMAEGIIQQPRDSKQLEDQGYEYFRDLVSRSIFQQSCSNGHKFVMHDLVHDLAELVSGKISFRLDEAKKKSRIEGVRHFSYPCGWYEIKKKFEVLNEVECLRTFLPINVSGASCSRYISSMVLLDLFKKFKKLRVLSLEGYYIKHLPNSIKELRLLRHLNLAGTKIISLPESVSSLYNLQILILRGCDSLQKLPSNMRNLINLRHLDIRGADLIREMPYGMKELTNLQTLSNFVMGKGTGSSGLKDMKNLTFLSRELCISGLEYVNDLWEIREASLGEKQNLEALSLEWGSRLDNSRNEAVEESGLDMLQPHTNIRKLTIKRYKGKGFPLWLGDPSFSNIVTLELLGCKNCTSLPALGLLGSLKDLTIRRMIGLKSIGSEIYGKDCSKPFQSLETLCLDALQEWKDWDTSKENEHIAIFPRLIELYITRCDKLSGKLPNNLPSLETLGIRGCEQLLVPFSSFPVLCKFVIYKCKGLVCKGPIDSKLIKSMIVSSTSLEIYGCKGMLYDGPTDSSSLLKSIIISNIWEFGKLLNPGFQTAESLGICDLFPSRWKFHNNGVFLDEPVQGLYIHTRPEEVSIEENCVRLISFPEVHFLPINLRSLVLENVRALKSLPEEMMSICAQLKSLFIEGCDSLTFIVRGKLPSSLETLQISECKKLQFLVDEDDSCASSSSSSSSPMRLKYLHINCCSELTAFSSRRRQLPEELEFLDVKGCAKLESVAESFDCNTPLKWITISDCENLKSIPKGLDNLSCLQRLRIMKCPNLLSFPERGLPITLSSLEIRECEKLTTLPDSLNKLNSLEDLFISKCPSIVSFPAEGFPTNLKSLGIMYKALIQWGLHRLTSLRSLYIDECDDAKCFPDEKTGMMLPTSLSTLSICGFQKLKCLSSISFQSLTSLEYLFITNCPKLKSLPEEGLPSSLLALDVANCPLLKKHCKRDRGKEWSKISHIPHVTINK